ncbi:hypothetical protein [Streptomyces lydicus]|uniref:hypothetical protein n=1 Tax=Streptomyces lydicus TaxID=47763 RepID=UPI003693793F
MADAPVVRRAGHWWLVSPSGTMLVTGPAFTGELDHFATDIVAANRGVADLHSASDTSHGPVRVVRR